MKDKPKKAAKMPPPDKRPDLYDHYDNPDRERETGIRIPDDIAKVLKHK